MIRKQFFILILSFSFLGCYEPVLISEACETSVDDAFVKSYFDFDPGTFWIYEEESSGELDTLSLFYHTHEFSSNPVDFFWLASSSKRGYNYFQCYYEDDHGLFFDNINGCLRNVVYAGYERPNGDTRFGEAFYIGATKRESLTFDSSFFIDELNELEVNGVLYEDVMVFLNVTDPCFGFDSVKYYVAEHYGVVRYDNFSQGEVWRLINCEIIK